MENLENCVVLKADRDAHVRNKHPWVFLGAIASLPAQAQGDIYPVLSSQGEHLGFGYFQAGQSICGRMFSFTSEDPFHTLEAHIRHAIELRGQVIRPDTTAYRLINGEGDNLPGLIVDRYGDLLVMQANTLGIEKLKPFILKVLESTLGALPIFEKSDSQTRRKAGLEKSEGWLKGQGADTVQVLEHGLPFKVSLPGSQKTGLFLDQREMRQLVRTYAKGKTVLNAFGYTGGFTVYALAGGAKLADTVDLSKNAIEQAQVNLSLNGFSLEKNHCYTQDVLEYLNTQTQLGQYDFMILDPPAFAKKSQDLANATRGYRELNRAAMQKLTSGSFLLTASCSSHVDKQLFQTIIFQAAKDARKNVKILSTHLQAPDHPINLFFPEGDYLKSLLLYVE
jgi:23S rRNA (cytosine1962-C5)-methyltransferase